MDFELKSNIDALLKAALEEDIASQDITSLSCLPDAGTFEAHIVAKENLRLAGISFMGSAFTSLDPDVQITPHFLDGSFCPTGSILASIWGPARAILSAERTALNLLQHMSGIATITSEYVQEIAGFQCDILDTRKTLPRFRALQKYAVRVGGGKNHRFSLHDAILIKNNHLKVLSETTTHPVRRAILNCRKAHPGKKIEIEVESLEQMEEALMEKADWILLDNMTVALMADAVKLNNNAAYLEASGGMNKSRVRFVAETGVNGISVGALTHSVRAVDISLRVKSCKRT